MGIQQDETDFVYNGEVTQKAVWINRTFQFGNKPDMLVFLLERMQGTIARLQAKVKGVPESVLSEQVDGKWSIKQNIGHLAEVDEISLKRIDEILNGISPMTSAVFPTKQDYNVMPVSEVVKYFNLNRIANLQTYNLLSEEELTLSAIHPRLKVDMNPVDLAFFHAEHDDHHLVRINEILKTLQV